MKTVTVAIILFGAMWFFQEMKTIETLPILKVIAAFLVIVFVGAAIKAEE